ncbi:MAG: hypothetical protein DRI61_13145 [Chloroflexi bacterium]|nr:MAG: hypothetical protein DRI61_13145 [Chloroflexota bacterium]
MLNFRHNITPLLDLSNSQSQNLDLLGLALTTRRIIESLDSLTVIETQAVDGSAFYRLTPFTQEQAELIEALRHIFPAEVAPRLLSEPGPSVSETAFPSSSPLLLEGGG